MNILKLGSATIPLIAIGVFLLPFNNIPVTHKAFGEFSREASFYPVFLAGILFLLGRFRGKVNFPSNLPFYLLLTFYAITVVGVIPNYASVSISEFQGRTGIGRFLTQQAVLLWGIFAALMVYDCAQDSRFSAALRVSVLGALVISGIYILLELRCILGYSYGHYLSIIERHINASPGLSYRVRGFSTEASWFAIYLAFAYAFFYVSLLASRGCKSVFYNILNIYAVVVFVMLYSRTALLVFFSIVITSFVLCLLGNRGPRRYLYHSLVPVLSICVYLMGNYALYHAPAKSAVASATAIDQRPAKVVDLRQVAAKDQRNLEAFSHSNQTRFAGVMAAFKVGLQSPVYGVGLGQYAFYAAKKLPQELLEANDELRHHLVEKAAWPVTYMMYARLFAETGFIGLLVWLILWGTTLYLTFLKMRSGGDLFTGAFLCAAGVALFLTGLSQDSFRYLGYWLFMGMAFAYIDANFSLFYDTDFSRS